MVHGVSILEDERILKLGRDDKTLRMCRMPQDYTFQRVNFRKTNVQR